MELSDFQGLRVGLIDVSEALDGDCGAHRGRVDVLRVERPAVQHWPALREVGFLPKPFLVTWIADAAASEEDFLARLTLKERQNIRAAWRRVDQDGLTIRIQPLDEQLLDLFLPLYVSRVSEMDHGWAVAAEQRAMLLDAKDEHFAVCVYDGDDLVGCCLGWQRPHLDILQIRFSAVDRRRRRSSLARVLYLSAARVGRERGFRKISLGMDPNIYGHIAKPGLFAFKCRLGFIGVPSNIPDPDTGHDQADLVLSLDRLSDPSLILSYADAVPSARLCMDVLSHTDKVDVGSYSAHFVTGHQIHTL